MRVRIGTTLSQRTRQRWRSKIVR